MDFSSYHIGVFDSGVGGRHVALRLQRELPGVRITALSDSKNIPYGKKTPAQLLECARPFIGRFAALEVDAIVIACNTCFVNVGHQLRQLTSIPIIGFEPALEPAAADSISRVVAVCATGGTLRSRRFQDMKAACPEDLEIVEIDCTDWVPLIEAGRIRPANLQPAVDKVVSSRADGLVLGCTHYHWVAGDILSLMPAGYDLKLYEPTERVKQDLVGVLQRVGQSLSQ